MRDDEMPHFIVCEEKTFSKRAKPRAPRQPMDRIRGLCQRHAPPFVFQVRL